MEGLSPALPKAERGMSEPLKQALSDLEEETVLRLVQERLDSGDDPMTIVVDCREGMARVGERYEAHEYYVSDLIMAAEISKQAMMLIGTVKGDVHDIGKDIVVSLLQAGGYRVVDLGVDVPPARFVEAAKESSAPVVGLSGLLTISFDAMRETVEALSAAGLRSKVKVMVGGGTVTEQVRDYVGADAMGTDAQAAVAVMQQKIDAVVSAVQNATTKPKVYHEVWSDPYMSAGKGSFIDQLIKMAGGQNIFENATNAYPTVNGEEIISYNPDIIIFPSQMGVASFWGNYSAVAARDGWGSISAVVNNRMYTISGDLIDQPAPRQADALLFIAQMIHPEIFGNYTDQP